MIFKDICHYVCLLAVIYEIRRISARTSPPVLIEEPRDLILYSSSNKELTCVAIGNPSPTYRWTKSGRPFDPNGMGNRITQIQNVGSILFNEFKLEDEGVYQCLATNQYGTAASITSTLIKSSIQDFSNKDLQTYRGKAGDGLKLRCESPYSKPPAEMLWIIRSPDIGFRQLIIDNRVAIDDRGNLYFANLRKSDQLPDTSKYVCTANNKKRRRFMEGYYSKIEVIGDYNRENTAPVTLAYKTPSPNRVAIAGEVFRLICIFYGNPTPTIKWIRQLPIGKEMPPKPHVYRDRYGIELVFNGIREEDAGTYQCQGTNDITANPVTNSYSIKVQRKPYWIDKPKNINAAVGDTVTFKCSGGGNPDAEVKWYINGVPLIKLQFNSKRIASKNELTFLSVTKADIQVIQCNVSNAIGFVYENAYLNVLTEAPTFVNEPKKDSQVAVGGVAILKCETFGAPKARITWKKDGNTLSGGRFTVHSNGNLEIKMVITPDAGNYSCTAKNVYGEVSSWGNLVVSQPTRIVEPPQDFQIEEGQSAKFVCKAETDTDQVQNLEINWMKHGVLINYSLEKRLFRNLQDNSLTITSTRITDTDRYSCVASTGIDSVSATAYLIIQGRPSQPIINDVKCLNAQADVRWQSSGNNYSPLYGYIIEFNTNHDPNTWTTSIPVDTKLTEQKLIPQNQNSAIIQLSPWTRSKFRVLAINRIGKSDPSEESTEECITLEDVPYQNPLFVGGKGSESDNMVIFWSRIEKFDQNGPGFKYKIKWSCIEEEGNECDKSRYPSTLQGSREVTNTKEDSLTISPLPTYTKFRITVMSSNTKGDCKFDPTPVIGYSGEAMPTAKVENVTVNSQQKITSESVNLIWDSAKIDKSTIRGHFAGYRVKFYKETDPKRGGFVDITPPNDSTTKRRRRAVTDKVYATVSGLPPYSRVVLIVMVLNSKYSGPSSTPLVITTPEGVPSQVQQFMITRKTSNTITFTWDFPENPNGILTGYDIGYAAIDGLRIGETNWINPVNDPNVKKGYVSGLKPNTFYRIYIHAKTKKGRGDLDFLDGLTHPADRPKPPVFSVPTITDSSFNVSWVPSSTGNPGSVFYVQYKKFGLINWQNSPKVRYQSWFNVSGLNSGIKYHVRVVAANDLNEEAPSSTQTIIVHGSSPYTRSVLTLPWFYIIIGCIIVILAAFAVICLQRGKKSIKYPVTKKHLLLKPYISNIDYHDYTSVHNSSSQLIEAADNRNKKLTEEAL